MILGKAQQFASPEEALQHFGVKGQKWGVRKKEELSGPRTSGKSKSPPPMTETEKKADRRKRAKNVAIGVGILTAVAGAGFVAYKLNQQGTLPLSTLKKAKPPPQQVAAVKKIIQEQSDVIHLSRGKQKGATFIKQGGTPNYFSHWEDAFVKEMGQPDTGNAFMKLSSGKIAAAFADPEGLHDFAGRPISHQVLVPKSMAGGLESAEDVKNKFWSMLKEAYLENYTKPQGRF